MALRQTRACYAQGNLTLGRCWYHPEKGRFHRVHLAPYQPAVVTASNAMSQSPLVPFLKPTGMLRPDAWAAYVQLCPTATHCRIASYYLPDDLTIQNFLLKVHFEQLFFAEFGSGLVENVRNHFVDKADENIYKRIISLTQKEQSIFPTLLV